MPSFLNPLLKNPSAPAKLVNARTGQVIASRLMSAFDSASRRTGLLKHDAMPDDAALIIAPCSAVHTFRMRFAIDVAFVSKEGRVLKVSPSVQPWRMAASLRAFAVIELAAGALAAADTRVGDSVQVIV